MDKDTVKKTVEKKEMINIRISTDLKTWIETEKLSPTKIFEEAVKQLGFKEE